MLLYKIKLFNIYYLMIVLLSGFFMIQSVLKDIVIWFIEKLTLFFLILVDRKFI